MLATFRPELPSATLTLVPLILIASALQAGLLKHRWELINTDPSLRDRRLRVALQIAYPMLFMCVAAELMALAELEFRTNVLNWPIFICSTIVSIGLGVALYRVITDGLVHGRVPPRDP